VNALAKRLHSALAAFASGGARLVYTLNNGLAICSRPRSRRTSLRSARCAHKLPDFENA
jgi:hypothetical protein